MSVLKTGAAVVAVLLLGLAAYESLRVFQARGQTPTLIAAIPADPEISRLSPERIDMLLRVEDPTFWSNDGTDYSSPGAGNTTLTQGLAKNLYFPGGFRPGFEKLELVLIAKFALTPAAAKRRILDAYLATVYLGNDGKGEIIGFPDGARRWYGKPLSQLSTDEYLTLVAMLYAPGAMNPAKHPDANWERVRRIKRLLGHGCAPSGLEDVELKGCAV